MTFFTYAVVLPKEEEKTIFLVVFIKQDNK